MNKDPPPEQREDRRGNEEYDHAPARERFCRRKEKDQQIDRDRNSRGCQHHFQRVLEIMDLPHIIQRSHQDQPEEGQQVEPRVRPLHQERKGEAQPFIFIRPGEKGDRQCQQHGNDMSE